MHAGYNDIRMALLSDSPELLLCRLAFLNLFLDEPRIASLGIPPDLGLVLILDVVWAELEWQALLLRVCNGADVEIIKAWTEEAVHGKSES